MKIEVNEWRVLCEKMMLTSGISAAQASTVVDAAISGDLRGINSHGTVRLPTYYARLKKGIVNKNPEIKIEVDAFALLKINGDNGLGQVVTSKAIDIAVERARKYGVCTAFVYNSNHMGVLAYYGLKAAEQGMVANITCNTPPFVAAFGGASPIIGTNPFCYAIPAPGAPFVLDMAVSPARGKIKLAHDKGINIPEGWAVDKEGRPTIDPAAALEGTLLPVGGVKGSGLGLLVEILSGILSSSNYGQNITHPLDDYEHAPNIGTYIQILDISKIMPMAEYEARIADYIAMVKSSKKAQGVNEIYMPGEIEHNMVIKNMSEGLDIPDDLYAKIKGLAQ